MKTIQKNNLIVTSKTTTEQIQEREDITIQILEAMDKAGMDALDMDIFRSEVICSENPQVVFQAMLKTLTNRGSVL